MAVDHLTLYQLGSNNELSKSSARARLFILFRFFNKNKVPAVRCVSKYFSATL